MWNLTVFADRVELAGDLLHRQVGGQVAQDPRLALGERVVTLEDEDGGTRLVLRHHDLPTDELCQVHREAWETYLHRLGTRITGADPGADPHR
jgi:hypothetical protein